MMAAVINKDLEENKDMLIPLLEELSLRDAKKHDNKEQLNQAKKNVRKKLRAIKYKQLACMLKYIATFFHYL